MKRVVVGAVAAIAIVGVASVGFAQKSVKKVDVKKKTDKTNVITVDKLSAAKNVAKIKQTGGSTESVKGPLDGTPCATPNPSTSTTKHSGVAVECTVGGEKASCTCDLECTNTCQSNGEFSSDCEISNCKVKVAGDGGGSSQVQVEGIF